MAAPGARRLFCQFPPMRLLALSDVIASVGTVTTAGTDSAQSLGLKGDETIDVVMAGEIVPQQELKLRIRSADGQVREVPVKSRIDTPIEVDYYNHGGILPFVLRELMGRAGPAKAKAA